MSVLGHCRKVVGQSLLQFASGLVLGAGGLALAQVFQQRCKVVMGCCQTLLVLGRAGEGSGEPFLQVAGCLILGASLLLLAKLLPERRNPKVSFGTNRLT